MNPKQVNTPKVTFIDAVMGSGKSEWAINYINNNKDKKFFVVCVTLDEVDRFCQRCDLYQPTEEPKNAHLEKLLEGNASIVTTHAMLKDHLPLSVLPLLSKYELILDEVISGTISPIDDIQRDTTDTLVNAKVIEIDNETKLIRWIEKPSYNDRIEIRDNILRGNPTYEVQKGSIVAALNPEIFKSFSKCYVLTYMHQYSIMSRYFKVYGIDYDCFTIKNGILSSDFDSLYSGANFRQLISIEENLTRTSVSDRIYLSYNRYGMSRHGRTRSIEREVNYRNITNYVNGFLQEYEASYKEVLWTCFKKDREKLEKANPYSSSRRDRVKFDEKNFLAHSARATNNYTDKKYLAYLIDKYINVEILYFFSYMGISFEKSRREKYGDKDYWALSELIQWVWRSAIRRGEEIKIYIPSSRMRDLFTKWLNEGIPC